MKKKNRNFLMTKIDFMKQNKHKVLIGYSIKMFSDGIESIIESFDNFDVIDNAPVWKKLSDLLKHNKTADILIIELNWPNNFDLTHLSNIAKDYPTIKILLLSHIAPFNMSSKLIESGISAYILKSCTKKDLLIALNKITDYKTYFCSDITKALIAANNHSQKEQEIILTVREREILSLPVNGNTNLQIAESLSMSENTVKTHRRNILSKFGVNNLLGMVRFACKSNLIDFGSDDFCSECPYCYEFQS